MQSIIEGLAQLVHFEDLHLECVGSPWPVRQPITVDTPVPLLRLKHLRRISLGGMNISVTHANKHTDQIRDMMKNGTILSSMALSLPMSLPNIHYESDQPPPQNILHDIFHEVPCKPNPALRHLLLSGYSLKPDVFMLPHLRGLTSLDISRAKGFQTPEADAELWSALQIASICLKDLVIEEVTASVLCYLDSYLGLEVFSVCGAGSYTIGMQEHSTEQIEIAAHQRLSYQLCSVTLPRHKESLISYNGYNKLKTRSPSYMTHDAILTLSVCKNLESLAFSLNISDIDSNDEQMLNDCVSTPNEIQLRVCTL